MAKRKKDIKTTLDSLRQEVGRKRAMEKRRAKQRGEMKTALDLLHGFLELRTLSRDLDEWTEERLTDNPPRLYRLQQLMALFRAFDLPWDPSSFIDGKFIQPEDPRYVPVMEKMRTENPHRTMEGEMAKYSLHVCFDYLFGYREDAERALSSGWLGISGFGIYSDQKVRESRRVLQQSISPIDDALVMLIDPEGREVSVERLVQDYGYPDVNLSSIDSDWV